MFGHLLRPHAWTRSGTILVEMDQMYNTIK